MEGRLISGKVRDVVILIGSNIDPINNSRKAIQEITQLFPVQKISSFWESEPIGSNGDNYINFAVMISTSVDYQILKYEILRLIETRLGRVRTIDKFSPRTIDLDIIIDGETTKEETLWTYAHIALPASELLPDLLHQGSGDTLKKVALGLQKYSWIRKIQLEE